MTGRLLLDESSWAGATEASLVGALGDAIERLLERLDAARARDEPVVKHENYYETDLGDGVRLYEALFNRPCPVRLDRDLTTRLFMALDRANAFDDSHLTQYDAEFHGNVRFAPGVVWAHTSCQEGRYVAVLPLPLEDAPGGQVPVTVDDATLDVFFVKEESQHVAFFRSLIALEHADETKFERLAPSAFPALDWADDVWSGLGNFSRPYIEIRDRLVRCLGGLSDHGAACFDEFGTGDPGQLASRLSANIRAETSDENGATKQHPQSRRDRTRRHCGIDKVFWWHVKLRPHVDRIHFCMRRRPGTDLDPARAASSWACSRTTASCRTESTASLRVRAGVGGPFWRAVGNADGVCLGVCAAGKITSWKSHQMAQNAAEYDVLSHHGAFLVAPV